MSARLYIAIPVRNRHAIVERCIPTVRTHPEDVLAVYDDGSEPAWPDGIRCAASGIEAQRRRHFADFWRNRGDFTHLYLTDSDAPHDPTWREHLLNLQAETGLPVCGYDTEAHVRLDGNTIEDDPAKSYILRRVAPGVSYLLTLGHVEKVMRHISILNHWDWMVPGLLGYRMCISRLGVVDHVGQGGLHHPADAGLDGGDRVRNPTPWLIRKRAEIVAELSHV